MHRPHRRPGLTLPTLLYDYMTIIIIRTDVVERSGPELGMEDLDADAAQVVHDERPQVETVVTRQVVAHLYDDDRGAKQGALDGHAETTRTGSDHEHLHESRVRAA